MGSKVSSIWELSPVLDVDVLNVNCIFCSGVGYFWYYVRRVNYLLRATITQRTVPLQYHYAYCACFANWRTTYCSAVSCAPARSGDMAAVGAGVHVDLRIVTVTESRASFTNVYLHDREHLEQSPTFSILPPPCSSLQSIARLVSTQ